MTADTENDLKNKQKAMALLALAADTVKMPGECPSDEEMAALVDDRVEEKAALPLLTHLGNCDKCYSEWLSLKKSKMQAAPRGRLYFLDNFRKLRYIGTALATAAGIALYLNIITMEHDTFEQRPAPQEILRQNSEPAALPSIPTTAFKKGEEPARVKEPTPPLLQSPLPASPATVGGGQKKDTLELQERLAVPDTLKPQKFSIASGQTEKKVVKETASDSASLPAKSRTALTASAAGEDHQIYLEELRTACLSGRTDSRFWAEMAARGTRLQPLIPGSQAPTDEERVSVIVALVQAINGPDSVVQQCRMILAELAKER